ncbi:hypothetical protein IFM89_008057, partial [Coptis chinensis]
MASPHSHHHCHHQQQQTYHSTCYSCCTSSCCSSLYQQQQPHFSPPCPPHHLQYHPQISTTTITDPLYQPLYSNLNIPQQPKQHNEQDNKKKTQALLTSLLRRIDALESTLPHFSSLRDIAARTIQTHFRAYLVRRSRTLRHLKHLAMIKTSLNYLKNAVSDKPRFNYQAISQKAMDLLLKLDFIQGGDPMIRDGKRSISRDLVHFLEFIEGVSVKRQQVYSKSMKKVKFAEDNEENEDSSLYMGAKGDCKDDDQRELIEELCKKVENIEGFARKYEENEEEAEVEGEGSSSKLSNGGRNSGNKVKSKDSFGSGSQFQGQNGNSLFSAPLPVQGEGSSSKLSNGGRNSGNKVKSKDSFGSGSQFQGQNGNSLFSAPLPVQMEEPVKEDNLLKRDKIVRE